MFQYLYLESASISLSMSPSLIFAALATVSRLLSIALISPLSLLVMGFSNSPYDLYLSLSLSSRGAFPRSLPISAEQ